MYIRSSLSLFDSDTVEEAHRMIAIGFLIERAVPEIVVETLDAWLEHARPLAAVRYPPSPRKRGPIRRTFSIAHGLWVPVLAPRRSAGTTWRMWRTRLSTLHTFLTRLQSEMRRDRGTPAGLHPFIDALGIVDDFRDGAVETEEAVGEIERVAGLGQRPHAAHEIGAAASHHHLERVGAVAAKLT